MLQQTLKGHAGAVFAGDMDETGSIAVTGSSDRVNPFHTFCVGKEMEQTSHRNFNGNSWFPASLPPRRKQPANSNTTTPIQIMRRLCTSLHDTNQGSKLLTQITLFRSGFVVKIQKDPWKFLCCLLLFIFELNIQNFLPNL